MIAIGSVSRKLPSMAFLFASNSANGQPTITSVRSSCVGHAAQALDRDPALLDEERGDEAPGDEGGDVRHDHAGQEGPELLHRDPGAARPARPRGSCFGVHGHAVPPSRAARTPHDVHRTALRRDRSPAAPIERLPSLPGPRQARSPMPPPTSPSRPFSHPWSGSHRSTNNDIAQVRPSARLLTNSDTR